MILHREDDAVVLGHFAELAHGLNDEAPAVSFPKPVLVVIVGVVVRRETVMERDATPRGEDLADRRAQIARQLDAFPHIADHGFALNRDGARKITVGRDRAQLESDVAGEIAQAPPVVGG